MRRIVTGAALLMTVALAPAADAQRFVPTADPQFPRIRYADSLTTPNDRCAVARQKLNLRVRPVYVNGQPVGFC